MTTKVIGGFIVNLLQDVNILRPLIYITADNLGIKPLILLTNLFEERDKSRIWINELEELAENTQASLYKIHNLGDLWQKLNSYTNGFLVSASESDLPGHKETHEIFKLTPPTITTITLQHGFECVGFLMNKQHQIYHGNSVGFASDYICGWTPKELQRNLRPLQYSRYLDLGPTAWLKQTNKRILNATIDDNDVPEMGIVCENLHSVRLGGHSNVNCFMQQFFELASYLDAKGKKIALRPHPGGQYSIKSNVSLPNNVVLVNQPSYKVNWRAYSFGISAPSSVLFDLMIHDVPVIVWQDQQETIDITQHAFLPVAQNTEDLISFVESPLKIASSSTNQQLHAIFRDENEISSNYTQLFASLCGLVSEISLVSAESCESVVRREKIRVLLISPAVTPTLNIAFVRPFSLMSNLIEYQIIHSIDFNVFDGESIKDATYRSARQIIDSFMPDVLVMCRYANKDGLVLSQLCKENNIKIVYYIDDLLFEPSLEVLDESKYLNYIKRTPTILSLIKKSDLLYCTTPALREELHVTTKHSSIHSGDICLSVDPEAMSFHRDRKKIIGYTGFGHTQDLEYIEDILLEVLSEYPDWSLELIGTMVPSANLRTLGDRLTIIPPERDYDEFISLLESRNWSIGICPLINNRFNTFKANNKWIEYSRCNIATIASDLDPYRYGSPENCLLLCNSKEKWKHSFSRLINSTQMIDTLVLNSQDVLRDRYSDKALSAQVYDLLYGLTCC